MENKYFPKLRWLSVTEQEQLRSNDFIPSATASQSRQSFFDPYDLSSDNEEYLTPKNGTKTTPGRSDPAVRLLTAPMLYLISLPESPRDWGQVNRNIDYYHSDRIEIGRTFWLPAITECWHQQEEMHSQDVKVYACVWPRRKVSQ